MITVYEIECAKTTTELDELVEKAAFERNCELNNSNTYAEDAEWFDEEAPKAGNGKDSMRELADLLRAADTKWFELER